MLQMDIAMAPIIVSLHDHVIEAEVFLLILIILIPRKSHLPQEIEFQFTFTCKQFPVKPAFTLT